jgi:hypothetical protein
MAFRLSDPDRKRFGLADEWVEFDILGITIADMHELSERFGFDPEDWPEPFLGRLTLEQAGDPDARPKPPAWRNHALCWMLLRQNGVDASWDDAGTVQYLRMRVRVDEPPGKDPQGASPSPTSEPSTTRRSGTSSASRRTKSTG